MAYYNNIDQAAFGNEGQAKLSDIKDGLSNTVAIGESKQGLTGKVSGSYGPWWGAGCYTCCYGRTTRNVTVVTVAGITGPYWQFYGMMNVDITTTNQGKSDAWEFGSFHPGGAHFVMCDGSTRFIPDSVDYMNVFVWMNRINDHFSVTMP